MSARRRNTRHLAACLGAAFALVVVAPPRPAAHADQGGDTTADPRTWPSSAATSGSIDDITAAPDAATPARLDSRLQRLARDPDPDATALVEVTGDDASIAAAVRATGGTLGRGGGGLYLARVPARKLATLATAAGVIAVQTPVKAAGEHGPARTERGIINGDSVAPVLSWHNAGYRGQGVKIGIIGLFDPATLATQITNGELPAIPAANTMCVSGGVACPFGTVGQTWGNSLAEIVADGAPDAQLYLAELGYRTDHYAVIDWMAANGVTIVLNPNVWTYDGPGNGTGPSAAIVDYAVAKGMAWFNTAGELGVNYGLPSYQGGYWRGAWADKDNDRWLNVAGTDESLRVYCGFLLGMRWSDWGSTRTDYDLYISDTATSTRKVLSANVQSATVPPLEANGGVRLCNTNPAYGPVYDTNKDGFVNLWVQRKSTSPASGAAGDVIEIAAYYGWMEYSTQEGSGAIAFADSANASMAAVGGRSAMPFLPRSATGPTNDGRAKPEFTQMMCVTTSLDGFANGDCTAGYFGADAAAAVMVGWAAVAKSALGIPTSQTLLLYLRDVATPSDPQLNGRYGVGGLLGSPPETELGQGVYRPLPSPNRIVDTRFGIGVPMPGPLSAGQTIKFNPPQPYGGRVAVVLNVAIVNATANGWISAYPFGYSYPGATSVLNADAGQNRANLVIVPDGLGFTNIYSNAGGHIIVDHVGDIVPEPGGGVLGSGYGGGRLHTTTPFRAVDTRSCVGVDPCSGAAIPGASFIDIPLRGLSNSREPGEVIPHDVTAVALSVTADTPAAKGFLSVVPGGQSTVPTSNLNFDAGGSATTLVFASVGGTANGVARVYVSQATHVQVDVLGWFGPAAGVSDDAGMFAPATPVRVLDTRSGAKPVADQSIAVDATAVAVPADADAVYVNNVSVAATAAGELQAGASGGDGTHPYRNLSFGAAGRPVAGSTISRLDAGAFVLSPSATTHVVTDLAGYFLPAELPATPPSALHAVLGEAPPPATDTRLNGMSDDAGTMLVTTFGGSFPFVVDTATGDRQEVPYYSLYRPTLSADGSTVGFITSQALVANDIDFSPDIYTYDLATATPHLVSGGLPFTVSIDSSSTTFRLSPDGSRVVINPYNPHVTYLYEAGTDTTTLLSDLWVTAVFSHDGTRLAYVEQCVATVIHFADGTEDSWEMPDCVAAGAMSFRGDWVLGTSSKGGPTPAFVAVLINVTTGEVTTVAIPAAWGTMRTSCIDVTLDGDVLCSPPQTGRLAVIDRATGAAQIVNMTTGGSSPNGAISAAYMTPDGRFVGFRSHATNMTSTPSPLGNIYLVDRTLLD